MNSTLRYISSENDEIEMTREMIYIIISVVGFFSLLFCGAICYRARVEYTKPKELIVKVEEI